MQDNIIERLFSSFTELETAIKGAKQTLEEKNSVPTEVIERLSSYDDILEKQRVMATKLCDHINKGEWDEVGRQVNLINGLSQLIRDDARAILKSIATGDKLSDTEKTNYC
ncbi:MAG: hypothetical protein KDD56_04175 [Bdellovibrionales bacterium]|nr:hypothetical protein [Bdellovibrionales bacterium]